MGSTDETSNVTAIDSSSPMFLHPSNIPGISLVHTLFSSTGFGGWKRNIILSLSAKNKIGFVDEIAESVQYSETTESIWEQLNKRYGTVNGTKVFEIKKELASTMQGALDITSYFNKLKKLWDKFRVMCSNKVNACAFPIRAELLKEEEEDRVHQFLMGLNVIYVGVRSNILMMQALPSLDNTYNILLQDEKYRQVNPGPNFSSESASFNVSGLNNKASFVQPQKQYTQRVNFDQSKENLSNLFCKYCKKPGHLIDKCYKLHGFPPNFKFTKDKRIAVNVTTECEFSNDSNPKSSGHTPNANNGVIVASEGQKSAVPGITQQQYTQLINLLQQSQLSDSITPPHLMASANFAGILLSDPIVSGSNSWPFLKKPLELGRVDDGLYKSELPLTSLPHNYVAENFNSCSLYSDVSPTSVNTSISTCNKDAQDNMDIVWHQRLAHVPFMRMKTISALSVSSK
ncbi:uncharacterized protein LOC107784468 [Nicotiana tabacum]|uniref:Uncharacterized protein LOC107784468 n=1 Tax=Nicotiana tabacum TaxID=4097 RepID=A0A1S3Z9N2_TOBAC|nr:PREDICTED: uncharacterized protein LOC107784468 [Nicotiana tabacum]